MIITTIYDLWQKVAVEIDGEAVLGTVRSIKYEIATSSMGIVTYVVEGEGSVGIPIHFIREFYQSDVYPDLTTLTNKLNRKKK